MGLIVALLYHNPRQVSNKRWLSRACAQSYALFSKLDADKRRKTQIFYKSLFVARLGAGSFWVAEWSNVGRNPGSAGINDEGVRFDFFSA
jgi:hypothetical protein